MNFKAMSLFSLILISLLTTSSCVQENNSNENLAMIVNPFIGTDGPGNTYPGAQVPFGMVQLSPDNETGGWDRISGYFYPDSIINTFSMTHLGGTGAGDLYDIAIMPYISGKKLQEVAKSLGEQAIIKAEKYSTFSHKKEQAHAGYYQVFLDTYGINVELTASARCGMMNITYPASDSSALILDLKRSINWDKTVEADMKIIDNQTVIGHRFSTGWAKDQKIYFAIKFSKAFYTDSLSSDSRQIGHFFFKTEEGEQIQIKCGLSMVSPENALTNLQEEMPDYDFNKIKTEAENTWNKELSKIEITTNNQAGDSIDKDKTLFYTCLYQSMCAPTIYMDRDSSYRGPDGETHKAKNFTNYTRFSLWDTYRAAHPLYTILSPNRVRDMVNSFLAFYDQSGSLPVWNFEGQETDMMIAHHSISVISEACLKDITGINYSHALEASIATVNRDYYRGIGLYKQYHYIPCDLECESLSKTIEYSYDDYCISQMASKLASTVEASDTSTIIMYENIAKHYLIRSHYYSNLYNKGWLAPRLSNGLFKENFNPDEYTTDITESNAWQYFFAAQHDVSGLINSMGGKKAFANRLDEMFTYKSKESQLPIFSTGMIGQYVHGNEPDHHVAYLYNYVGEAEKTQKYVHEIVTKMYKDEPNGHCGNEDCGQMSSWYVLSTLGFYPVNPVSCKYDLGTPNFEKAIINLPSGKKFIIKTKNFSKNNPYVEKILLNGTELKRLYITHEEIMKGGVLKFIMEK